MRKFVPIDTPLVSIESVKFSVMSNCDISKQSEIPINNREIYYYLTNKPYPYGVLDLRLGTNRNDQKCKTCGLGLTECLGHWGYIDLHLPVFHVGFFKYIIQILSCICKKCSYLLLSESSMKIFRDQAMLTTYPLAKRLLFKKLVTECKKVVKCPRCNSTQGTLKRIVKPTLDQFMKIRHTVKEKHGGKMQTIEEDLDPLYVKSLFKSINPVHLLVLNIDKPENLIISSIPVPPSCIRPSVTLDEQGSTEDDLTCILSDIVDLNNVIKSQCKNGFHTNQFIGNWQFMQLQATRYINSESPAVSQLLATKNITKTSRGICQRLKGKEGRFRGNLSGKRVDFSARTVISPDPNVGIDQVVVPKYIAQRLTYPERVNKTNINILKRAVLNGPDSWPGACYVNKIDGSKCNLRYANPKSISERLVIGDIVERHIWDGDVVLFNRQPSLHRMSIMAHRAIVMDGSTFRFNECVCSPYNADFDGDEMNLHFPQTEEARAEAFHLMGVKNNLTSPKNGEPLVAAVQDFLSASYLLTSKDYFLERKKIFNLSCSFCDSIEHIDVPPPAIIYPVQLWTGKQLFSLLLSPSRHDRTYINLELKEREFKPWKSDIDNNVMSPNDGYVVISNSELMCGSVGKKTLGPGKSGLIFHLLRNHGSKSTSRFLSRISKLTCRWLCEYGLSIGLDDVIPSDELVSEKKIVLTNGYRKVDSEIEKYNQGEIQAKFGCSAQETLELIIKGELDDLRNQAGRVCYEHLPPQNKPLIMFNSGAKGSLINIAQMIACVGQQNVSGQRIQNGFVKRSLPHFEIGSLEPKSRGFVANSFFTGLDPQEFFFHTMSGREGLIDTAVKTAETGYMQRRLMKALEDLSVCYDHTVRTSDGQIVQFLYGDDGISPCSLGVYHMDETLKMLQARSNSNQFGDFRGPILPPNESLKLDLDVFRGITLPKFLQQRLESLQYLKSDENAYEMISNQLKCYYVIHSMRDRMNVPLFPFEIKQWSRFISRLVSEFIPARLSQHFIKNNLDLKSLGMTKDFETEYLMWIDRKADEIAEYRRLEGLDPGTSQFTVWPSRSIIQKIIHDPDGRKRKPIIYEMPMNKKYVITLKHLYNLCISCWRDYKNAIAEPGDAVGALGAQSIGEPGTQMTLKTFHFAGVASMNVTLGVPRIKEIINATLNIQTPIIEVPLISTDFESALINKYKIEKTSIGNICKKFEDIYSPRGSFIIITIDESICIGLGLNINSHMLKQVILNHTSINKTRLDKNSVFILDDYRLSILVPHTNSSLFMFQKQSLINGLMSLVLSGEKQVKRGVIKKEGDEYHLAVEGYGLLNIMGVPGVIGTKVKSNHVIEIAKVLGIEAARSVIINEICKCMDAYSIEIDYRHMCLLGDVMTFRGEVLGINRFGIQKMRTSTLMLASFEETNEHLFEAAVHNRKDPINGVSECIITGKPIKLGTGSFDILLD